MATLQERVGQALQRLASGRQGNDFFAIGRVQTVGEPVLWEEAIAFERGGLQTFARTRSTADEGGAAIGIWSMPADDWRVHAFANALNQLRFCAHASDKELMPGMDIIDWSCVTDEGTLDLLATGTSPLLPYLAPLELELRRLANDLESQRQGASLRLALKTQVSGNQVIAKVGLMNDASRPGIVINPFTQEPSDFDFFRLEIAPLPQEQPGETGYGAEFTAIPVEFVPKPAPAPWADSYLLLKPAQPLILPNTAMVGPLAPGSYILRAVYSNYGLLQNIAGVPVIRGRAFSNEVELVL